jgi:transcriptional regulator with XRE-family HTH domain
MIDTKKLAVAVRARRGKLSLRKAAEKSGVSYPTLSKIENGDKPDLETFIKVCRWIELPTEYFTQEQAEAA